MGDAILEYAGPQVMVVKIAMAAGLHEILSQIRVEFEVVGQIEQPMRTIRHVAVLTVMIKPRRELAVTHLRCDCGISFQIPDFIEKGIWRMTVRLTMAKIII